MTISAHSRTFALLVLGIALTALCLNNARARELSDADLRRVVDSAYAKYKDLKEGKNADYIPILATVPSDLFGVVIVTRDGKVFQKGDVDYEFSIQSVAKPFTASLVMQQHGPQAIVENQAVGDLAT